MIHSPARSRSVKIRDFSRKTSILAVCLAAVVGARAAEGDWPSFRGPRASGVADGQGLPDIWDAAAGTHLRWKVRIPGLAHSSPVIWGDRLFVTTAVSGREDASFKHGLYGSGDASEDQSVHRWRVLCLDKKTGKLLWERTAHEGRPRDKRHIKATYANSTPVTDGRHVVALFGSVEEGPRPPRRGRLRRAGLRVGVGQLADPPRRAGHRAVRHAGRFVRDGHRRGDR